ncbi:mCG148048 [Mus musculus]|nr:mCG148048 [Mus musculus]
MTCYGWLPPKLISKCGCRGNCVGTHCLSLACPLQRWHPACHDNFTSLDHRISTFLASRTV